MKTDFLEKKLMFVATLAVFFGYLLPEWYAYFASDINVFVNAWDEETYLSWQGILGVRNTPGYFLLYINWLLHLLGISGAMQNLLFDTLLPPALVYLAYRSLQMAFSDLPKILAFAYATVIFFSSTLFNYTNPLVKYLVGPYDNGAVFMAGWELYPSVLRTPNPQTSYLLIALAVFLFLKIKKQWILLLPLPLLYFHIAIPYFFLLLLGYCYGKVKTKFSSYVALIISFGLTYLSTGIALSTLMYIMGVYRTDHPFRMHSVLLLETRQIQFSVILLLFLAAMIVLDCLKIITNRSKIYTCFYITAASIFGATNLHMVSGIMLGQKNYYDYGVSILLGLCFIALIELIRLRHVKTAVLLITLATLATVNYLSQVGWCKSAILVSKKISPKIETLRKDPLMAIIPDITISSKVAYSTPMMLHPLFSYQYQFIRDHDCSSYHLLLAKAMAAARADLTLNSGEILNLEKFVFSVGKYRPSDKSVNGLEPSYCLKFNVTGDGFYVYNPL